ncbi:hypothetical protein [Bacteroides oleiciplenus]|uniref:Uncharacterized protein n=1 Tax=Bacteroides oleiciplenus TaxID=626931 RepID=A0A3E5B1E4_9BACE|nr:hypothetical protein [Bacteroides oleiciplenus]RGN31411.1 hypothetical protein DXB65_21125 [Bacteroides oleiciplenus]
MIKYKLVVSVLILCLLLGVSACGTSKKQSKKENVKTEEISMNQQDTRKDLIMGGSPASTSPVVYIYKMKADYSNLVPVIMDGGRSRIVSYPHPKDLFRGKELCLPTPLVQGYWLDNRGIGPNVAFLTYTYEEYSKLPVAPSMEDLLANIADKYPLLEIHACGRRADYKDIVSELNEKISEGFLQK